MSEEAKPTLVIPNSALGIEPTKSRAELLEEKFAKQREDAQKAHEARKLDMLEAIAEAQETFGVGNVRGVLGRHGFTLVRAPAQANYRKYTDLDKPKSEHMMALTRPFLVPLKGETHAQAVARYEALCEVEPGMILAAASSVVDLGGATAEDLLGKRND